LLNIKRVLQGVTHFSGDTISAVRAPYLIIENLSHYRFSERSQCNNVLCVVSTWTTYLDNHHG